MSKISTIVVCILTVSGLARAEHKSSREVVPPTQCNVSEKAKLLATEESRDILVATYIRLKSIGYEYEKLQTPDAMDRLVYVDTERTLRIKKALSYLNSYLRSGFSSYIYGNPNWSEKYGGSWLGYAAGSASMGGGAFGVVKGTTLGVRVFGGSGVGLALVNWSVMLRGNDFSAEMWTREEQEPSADVFGELHKKLNEEIDPQATDLQTLLKWSPEQKAIFIKAFSEVAIRGMTPVVTNLAIFNREPHGPLGESKVVFKPEKAAKFPDVDLLKLIADKQLATPEEVQALRDLQTLLDMSTDTSPASPRKAIDTFGGADELRTNLGVLKSLEKMIFREHAEWDSQHRYSAEKNPEKEKIGKVVLNSAPKNVADKFKGLKADMENGIRKLNALCDFGDLIPNGK